jgi:hypothetical protein
MPVVSAFFGILIRMFYKEHGPPHFHAEYSGQRASFTFDGEILAGRIRSRTALRLIREWTELHRVELAENWRRIELSQPIERIEPLE